MRAPVPLLFGLFALGCLSPPGGPRDGVPERAVRVFFTEPSLEAERSELTDALVTMVSHTRHSLDIAAYALDLPPLVDAVREAHERGVAVRVVGDEDAADDPGFVDLVDAGVEVVFRTTGSGIMHDKFVLFDDQAVWTGSTNFTENGVYLNNNDSLILPSPDLVERYRVEFDQMFDGVFGRHKEALVSEPIHDGIELMTAPEQDTIGAVVSAIDGATTSVHFLVFSFTRSDVADALVAASERGVDVVGVVDTSQAASGWSQDDWLAEQGLPIYLDGNHESIGFAGGKLHHKLLIVDAGTPEAVVLTGSSNWSNRAAEENDENLLILRDVDLSSLYEASFWDRVDEGEPHPAGAPPVLGF